MHDMSVGRLRGGGGGGGGGVASSRGQTRADQGCLLAAGQRVLPGHALEVQALRPLTRSQPTHTVTHARTALARHRAHARRCHPTTASGWPISDQEIAAAVVEATAAGRIGGAGGTGIAKAV
jgi:hypothetical protein